MSSKPRLLLFALCLSALACTSDARRREQARIARLVEHVDRLRRADNADKRPLLAALIQAQCEGAEACALKDLCVRAYELHQSALDTITELTRQANRDGGTAHDSKQRLEKTESDLLEAKELSQRCAEEQVKAVRKTLM